MNTAYKTETSGIEYQANGDDLIFNRAWTHEQETEVVLDFSNKQFKSHNFGPRYRLGVAVIVGLCALEFLPVVLGAYAYTEWVNYKARKAGYLIGYTQAMGDYDPGLIEKRKAAQEKLHEQLASGTYWTSR